MPEGGRISSLLEGTRQQGAIAVAALTGVLVGLTVAVIERLVDRGMLHALFGMPLAVQAAAPAVGLAVAALALRYTAGGASPATADEYVANFHDRRRRLPLAPVPGRLLAGIATLGSGGAMGLEGPSIYAGAAIGSGVQHRLRHLFRGADAKLLLVAGAAAGVAAVFKAPATGVIFALEVPYTDDVARRALIPALIASAASYVTFVFIVGTQPLFVLTGTAPGFGLVDLSGAVLLGVAAGGGARLFAVVTRWAKAVQTRWPAWQRVAAAGVVLAGLTVLTVEVYDQPFNLGPGYEIFGWADQADLALGLVALLFLIRLTATTATLAGGGAGGIFIPLAVQGVLLGRLVAGGVGQAESALYPIIGIAAFLGAGYRTPLASVMFVAETTGRPLFVVPALIAAATSQLMMGRWSVSSTQQSVRSGHLERRFRLPIASALTTDVLTVPPDATAAEFVWVHVVGHRQRAVPVVDGDRYLGLCLLEDVSELPREVWDETTVAALMRTGVPAGRPSWTLRDAMVAMEDAEVDRLAVTDDAGVFVGVVLLEEILKLDEILDETGG